MTNFSVEATATDPERAAFAFMEGAPNVALTGLDLLKAMLTQMDGDREPGDESETDIDWSVTSVVTGGTPPLVVVGNLEARHGDFFVGCLAFGHVAFRDPSDCPARDDKARLQAFAAWASSPLYDFAATHARSLVGGSVACTIRIPALTPLADLEKLEVDISLGIHQEPEEEDRR